MGNDFEKMKPKQIVKQVYKTMEKQKEFGVLNSIVYLGNALIKDLYYKSDASLMFILPAIEILAKTIRENADEDVSRVADLIEKLYDEARKEENEE